MSGSILTKSGLLGLSIGMQNVGTCECCTWYLSVPGTVCACLYMLCTEDILMHTHTHSKLSPAGLWRGVCDHFPKHLREVSSSGKWTL